MKLMKHWAAHVIVGSVFLPLCLILLVMLFLCAPFWLVDKVWEWAKQEAGIPD